VALVYVRGDEHAARETFRRDQQSWTFAFRRDQQSWTNRFHSMTKKLCSPITQRWLTKWPAIANRFIIPGLHCVKYRLSHNLNLNMLCLSVLYCHRDMAKMVHQLYRPCIPNLSCDHFKQLCTTTDKTTSEQFLPHETN